MRRILPALFLALLLASWTSASVKPEYGGNLKVAEDLLGNDAQVLFDTAGETLKPLFPLPFTREETSVTVDFSGLGPETAGEIEKAITGLQNQSAACHWILDYPYMDHRHSTSISFRDGVLAVKTESPDVLRDVLSSPCLIPEPVAALQPFRRTQFGYEANPYCATGRPFLDSITPAPVDPVNPYLSMKLNDADVIPVPEERYAQISRDPDLVVIPGARNYLFLQTEGIGAEAMQAAASSLHMEELQRTVLNNHAETLLNRSPAGPVRPGMRIHFQRPPEAMYQLLADRIAVELQDAGFQILPPENKAPAPTIRLVTFPIRTTSDDLLRYQVLRNQFDLEVDRPWFEVWDEMESEGRILPLLVHTTLLASRKNIRNLRVGPGGVPDFSNAWIESLP